MLRLFLERGADERRARGRRGLLRHWARGTLDMVANGIGARWDSAKEGKGRAGAPAAGSRGGNNGGGGMDSMLKDVQYAARSLLKSPALALIATVTIALGVGANTAIFSVVRAVLLAPLPYEQPRELVLLWGEMRARDVTHFPMSPPDFIAYRDGAEALEDLAAVFTFSAPLTGEGDPVQVDAAQVTTNFFSLLGIEPVLGRAFVEEDGAPDPPGTAPGAPGASTPMVILSHSLWQQRFGGASDVLGRSIEISGAASQIVGVMPPGFDLLMPPESGLAPRVDIWIAARIDYENAPANNVFLRPIGRLRDGATIEQLRPQIDRIAASLAAGDQIKGGAGYAARAESLHDDLTADVRPVLLALFGAVVFVLLIACANVSNLMLVRASSRDREFALRAAIGGTRGRLIRQVLVESGLLALMGALMGIALAAVGIKALLALSPENLPRMEGVRIDGPVLLFTVIAASAAAVLCGLLPALQSSRPDLADALKERGTAGANAAKRLVRNGIVIVEVALSVVLLIGAGLMVRSFVELNRVEPGFDPDGVLTFSADPQFVRYPLPADRWAFSVELRRRIEALPGVEAAARTFPLPLSGELFGSRYGPEDALDDPEAFRQANYRQVTPGYFEAMGTRLVEGRTFTDADDADSTGVVVVDVKLAESLWPNASAVGQRFLIRAFTPEPEPVEVIGVVEHERVHDLSSDGPETVYFTDRFLGSFGGEWVVKSGLDQASLIAAIRAEIGELDSNVPIADVELMQSRVDRAEGPTRFALTLIMVFGATALLLASVGLYGVLSSVVRQRTAEIGVRMAFGAASGGILKLMVGQGLALALGGVGLGVVVAMSVTGIMDSLLVGVTATDPLTFAGISALFLAVAALACYLPARRAARIDPATALREE